MLLALQFWAKSPDYVLFPPSSLKGIQRQSLKDYCTRAPPPPKKKTTPTKPNKLNTPKAFPIFNLWHIFANQECNNFLLFCPPPPLTSTTRHTHFSSKAGSQVDCLQLWTPTDNAEASRILLSALITCLDSPSP